jgi:hypothetical protein
MSTPLKPNFSDAISKKAGHTRFCVPIPTNQSCFLAQATALPAQVRDLADLLAQIAADELMQEQAARKEPGQ